MKHILPCILKMILRIVMTLGLRYVESWGCDHALCSQINILCEQVNSHYGKEE